MPRGLWTQVSRTYRLEVFRESIEEPPASNCAHRSLLTGQVCARLGATRVLVARRDRAVTSSLPASSDVMKLFSDHELLSLVASRRAIRRLSSAKTEFLFILKGAYSTIPRCKFEMIRCPRWSPVFVASARVDRDRVAGELKWKAIS